MVLVDVNREGGEGVAAGYGATFSPTDVADHALYWEVDRPNRGGLWAAGLCGQQRMSAPICPYRTDVAEMWERVIAVKHSRPAIIWRTLLHPTCANNPALNHPNFFGAGNSRTDQFRSLCGEQGRSTRADASTGGRSGTADTS